MDHLGNPDAVLIVDEAVFLKKGAAGKIIKCQIGVFATHVSGKDYAFLDRALHLPKSWTDKPERLTGAHVPHEIRFAKPDGRPSGIGVR